MDPNDINAKLARAFDSLTQAQAELGTGSKGKVRARRPYYNETYGMAARELVDQLMADTSIPIKLAVHGVSPSTERQKLYQGLEFLVEQMDTDGKYAQIRPFIRTHLGADHVIVRMAAVEFAGFTFKKIAVDYVDEVSEFINNAEPGQKYNPEPVILTDGQVLQIRALLANLGDAFTYIVMRSKLYIIRNP